jgi:hypothetical protein
MFNLFLFYLKLICWVVLAVFVCILQKRIEKVARESLMNMPIIIASIENEAISAKTTFNYLEKRKAEIQRNVDKIAFIDTQSRHLCRIIPCIGLLCFVGSFVIELNDTYFIPGFINKETFFVCWNAIIFVGFIIMLFFAISVAKAAQKEIVLCTRFRIGNKMEYQIKK